MIVTVFFVGIVVFLAATYWTHASPYSQFFGKFIYRAKTDQKIVALTFDDGPNQPFTTELLDFLKSQHIKATFFVVGKCVEKYPEVLKKIYADGHTIGNHSYSHQFSQYFKQPTFRNEINKTQSIIKKTIGVSPALFRPPWLYRQPALFSTLKKLAMKPISGTFCHPFEVANISAEKIARYTIKHAKPGAIIIFHDGHDSHGGNRRQTVDSIKIVVKELRVQGYEFVAVDKLLDIPAYKLKRRL